jgi:peptide/nickel transport system substrate-binding protein
MRIVERVRRSSWYLVGLACIAVVAAACGSSPSKPASSPSSGSTSSSGIKHGGAVTYAIDQTIPGFNINTSADAEFVLQEVMNQVWPSVFVQGADLKPVLNTDLVTSAKVTSTSPETIVYDINPKAVWSDGTPINADDFIYNWQAQSGQSQYKDINGQAYDDASTTGFSSIQSVTGSNGGHTVTVTFSKPFGDWQSLFSDLVPAHVAKKVGWNTGFNNWQNIVSGGPFVISNYVKDQTVTETPNPKWWGKKAYLSSLTFRILSDDSTGPAAMQNNEVQVFNPSAASQSVQKALQQVPGITTDLPAGLEFEHLDFNEANPYLAKVGVRQAIALGIDRQDLINRTVGELNSAIKPIGNRLFLPTQPQYVDNGSAYAKPDPAKAKQLLQAAGMTMGSDGYFHPTSGPEAGQDFTLTLETTSGEPLRQSEEEIVQSDLKAIGVKIQIQNADAATFFGTNLPKGEFQLAIFAWVDTIYPSGNLSIYCSYTNTANCGENWNHYANPQVDSLLNQAVGTIDPVAATKLYNQADKLLWTDMDTLPFFQRPIQVAWDKTVQNIVVNTSSQGITWNATLWGFQAS